MPGYDVNDPPTAAHEAFAKPTANHAEHVGIDGKIGRTGEVSGLGGSDPRRTVNADEIKEGDMKVDANAAEQPKQASETKIQGDWEKIKKADTIY